MYDVFHSYLVGKFMTFFILSQLADDSKNKMLTIS